MSAHPGGSVHHIRKLVAAVLAGGAVLFAAGPAWAHIVISPSSAPQGGDAVISFDVPNEKDGTNTTEVAVKFPEDHPIAEAAVQPVPGWSARVQTNQLDSPIQTDDGEVTEAVSTVTWTADVGGGIQPGEFEQFPISIGPLP